MIAKLKVVALVLLMSPSLAGCAPKEMFSCIDRHCFCADWINHHSCVNCCCEDGCQQHRAAADGEMLVLGNQAPAEASIK